MPDGEDTTIPLLIPGAGVFGGFGIIVAIPALTE